MSRLNKIPILVLGGSGAVGSAMVKKLASADHKVMATFNTTRPEVETKNVEWIPYHITNTVTLSDSLDQLFVTAKPRLTINCLKAPEIASYQLQVAINSCVPLLLGNQRVIHISTNALFPGRNAYYWSPESAIKPHTDYEMTKALGEQKGHIVIRAAILALNFWKKPFPQIVDIVKRRYDTTSWNGVTNLELADWITVTLIPDLLAKGFEPKLLHYCSTATRWKTVVDYLVKAFGGSCSQRLREPRQPKLLKGDHTLKSVFEQIDELKAAF